MSPIIQLASFRRRQDARTFTAASPLGNHLGVERGSESKEMDGLRSAKAAGGPPLQLFNCTFANCGAAFSRQWKLQEHETAHTGAVRETDPLPHPGVHTAASNFTPFAVAMSVHCCWLRSSVLEEVSPEPAPASARRSQTIQVSLGLSTLPSPASVTHF